MGIMEGLKKINAYNEEQDRKRQEREERENGPKTVWFALEDGKSAKIRPLQELDKESPNYSEKNGIGFIAVEHSNPKAYKRKAICSLDDQGNCLGCEKHREDYKAGWGQKSRLYVNVLVDNGTDDPYVAVLSQGTGPKSVTPTLIEYAGETGSITNRWWKISRKGKTMNDTSWTLMAYDVDDKVNPEDYEVFDLKARCVRDIPYEDQAKFYLGEEAATETKEPAAAGASSSSFDW